MIQVLDAIRCLTVQVTCRVWKHMPSQEFCERSGWKNFNEFR